MLHTVWNQVRWMWKRVYGCDRKRIRQMLDKFRDVADKAPPPQLSEEDLRLVTLIRRETVHHNRNNLTRTDAYLAVYQQYPELHWALLAHVVSRNGGWNMTDLHGEWFRRVASPSQRDDFFAFLERANFLIFGDAYPQLLLYKEGKRTGKNLSRLLPVLGVSRFMRVVWDDFWDTSDKHLLTTALIINEQNYIEHRVVQNSKYASAILASVEYQLQSLLNLNYVVIPYRRGDDTRVVGTAVEHFMSLHDRIQTGQRLYRVMVQDRFLHHAISSWMCETKHSGSRADYWPHIYALQRAHLDVSRPYVPRFQAGGVGAAKLYSPLLLDVWPEVRHEPPGEEDWFTNFDMLIYLFDRVPSQPKDSTDEYLQALRVTEQLLMAKDKVAQVLPAK